MRPLLKATVIVVSLMCAASVAGLASDSNTSTGRIATPHSSVVAAGAMGLALDPSVWLTDVQSLMVANYEAGVADQERADAEAARAATEVAGAPDVPEIAPRNLPAPAATPIPAPEPVLYVGGIHAQPFLICVRRHESDRADVNGNGLYDGGYAAKNPSSSAAGAYQFLTSTWNSVVNAMGHPEWAGDPRNYSDDVQDQVAWWTYTTQGPGPWSGSGCG